MHSGSKINTLRDVLQVFIKSIPGQCAFNIYSFGSDVQSLWVKSQEYTQENVDVAMQHVAGFKADMGGTEISNALGKAVQNRDEREDYSTQIILVTDGEVWNTDYILDFVKGIASKRVRFFALGIGNQVSHRLVEGIGRHGGGFGEVISDTHGRWDERVIRMLKGALMPESWSYEVEIDGVPTKSMLVRNGASKEPEFLQAPFHTPPLHSFAHQSVFFLLDSGISATSITINATTPSGHKATTTLPVQSTSTQANAVHFLAAKAALRDLEEGKSWIHEADFMKTISAPIGQIERREGERLGLRYHITSKWTSFVAVACKRNSDDRNRRFEPATSDLFDLLSSKYHGTMNLKRTIGVDETSLVGSRVIKYCGDPDVYARDCGTPTTETRRKGGAPSHPRLSLQRMEVGSTSISQSTAIDVEPPSVITDTGRPRYAAAPRIESNTGTGEYDWRKETDPNERRKIKNKLAQRKFRM